MKTTTTIAIATLTAVLAACQKADPAEQQAIATLQQQVNELQAREAIRELFTAYGRTLDSRDFKTFGELYAQDGEYVGGGSMGVSKGPAAIAAALENVITTNASGANLHVYSNEKITITGTDSAAATSRGAFYVQNETGGPIPLMFATYKDEFVREGGVWKFKRREVVGDIPGPSNEERAAAAK